jgi:hypothetical protein
MADFTLGTYVDMCHCSGKRWFLQRRLSAEEIRWESRSVYYPNNRGDLAITSVKIMVWEDGAPALIARPAQPGHCHHTTPDADISEPQRSVPRSFRARGQEPAGNSTSAADHRHASAGPHGYGNERPPARRPRQWNARRSPHREPTPLSPTQRPDAPSEQHVHGRSRRSSTHQRHAPAGRPVCVPARQGRCRGTPPCTRPQGHEKTAGTRR